VKKQPDPLDNLQKALAALVSFVSALTGAALAGHTIGWW
jgi:hypothetical protein